MEELSHVMFTYITSLKVMLQSCVFFMFAYVYVVCSKPVMLGPIYDRTCNYPNLCMCGMLDVTSQFY